MRPYEETWSAKEVVVARDDGKWIARFSPSPGESPDVEAARAQLAAQAPAMARLLLEMEWAANLGHNTYGCALCQRDPSAGHDPDCALVAILSAAGMLP